MAITEGPRTFSDRPPWHGTRRFFIDGESNPLAAAGLPEKGEGWPGTPSVICLGNDIEKAEPGGFTIVRSDYSFVPDGVVDVSGDPLDWTPRVSMFTMEVMVPVDVDLDGRPYVNLVGDPVDPGMRRVTYKRLMYSRYEPLYDTGRCDKFENRQNSRTVSIGAWVIKPYHMRLNSYSIIGEVSLDARYVNVGYELDFFLTDALGSRPFDHPYLNQGLNGWYTDGTNSQRGRFVTATADNSLFAEQSSPIRLGLDGKPLTGVPSYSRLRIGSALANSQQTFAPIANPSLPKTLLTESIVATGTTTGYRIWFRGTKEADLNELGL